MTALLIGTPARASASGDSMEDAVEVVYGVLNTGAYPKVTYDSQARTMHKRYYRFASGSVPGWVIAHGSDTSGSNQWITYQDAEEVELGYTRNGGRSYDAFRVAPSTVYYAVPTITGLFAGDPQQYSFELFFK